MCGIIGIYSEKKIELMSLLYFGLLGVQHRGQESSGVILSNGETELEHLHFRRLSTGKNSVDSLFAKKNIPIGEKFSLAIGHNRYSTSGSVKNINNIQPLLAKTRYGTLGIAHNGNLPQSLAMRDELSKQGDIFFSDSDTEIILKLIARSKRSSLVEAIIETLEVIGGSYSLLFITKDEIIAARDPYGIRPLCLGQFDHGYMIASEQSSFNKNLGVNFVREIERGEILVINNEGLKTHKMNIPQNAAHCIFELIYFARPDSFQFDHSVADFRMQTGKLYSRRHSSLAIDAIVPIPDSAMYFAQGYSDESGLPLKLALLRNHYIGRTFITPGRKNIQAKLSPIESLIRDRHISLVDDSIVRGTTSKNMVDIVRECEPKAVHFGVASPPIIGHCSLGIDIKSEEELAISGGRSVEDIRQSIHADTLNYLCMEDLRKATSHPDDFCYGCFTGKYPV